MSIGNYRRPIKKRVRYFIQAAAKVVMDVTVRGVGNLLKCGSQCFFGYVS